MGGSAKEPRGVYHDGCVARIISAFYNNINDCDETYNYWEPAHFLVHGNGFQTWEYSPVYALRSYAYIIVNIVPLYLLNGLIVSKIAQFYLLRTMFALVSSACEAYLYSAVKNVLSRRVSLLFFMFLIPSCGMFISSTAFLPSSFTMYCTMISLAAWLYHREHIAIFAIALGSILGWPFAAVLGVPLAINLIIFQKRIVYFLKYSFLSLIIIGGPVLLIDSVLYGRIVFAPLNIIAYNVFGKGGPDLYGTEPWTYYFNNGFLNLNVAFLLCLLCLLVVEFKVFSDRFIQRIPKQQQRAFMYRPIIMAVWIWIAIFFTRPHKEERFLFPIYPLVYLSAAISLHLMNELVPALESVIRVSKSLRMVLEQLMRHVTLYLVIIHCILGISRILVLYTGYSAPIKVYSDLNLESITDTTQSLRQVNLCVGKEWYRFPSSFFLPNNGLQDSKWQLKFIKSDFGGQLPQPYSSLHNATAVIPANMNDMNREEPSRYVSIDSCHYLIDSEVVTSSALSEHEPSYHTNTQVWELVYSYMFLDARRSPKSTRAFYIPQFIPFSKPKYINYHLLRKLL